MNSYARLEFQQRKVLTDFALALAVRTGAGRCVLWCEDAALPGGRGRGLSAAPLLLEAPERCAASRFYFFVPGTRSVDCYRGESVLYRERCPATTSAAGLMLATALRCLSHT